jgi:hypothetical protein
MDRGEIDISVSESHGLTVPIPRASAAAANGRIVIARHRDVARVAPDIRTAIAPI